MQHLQAVTKEGVRTMEQVRLGRSGLKVSRICLGTMTFGDGADEALSFQIMDRFVELGGTFIDTADQYNAGVSEEMSVVLSADARGTTARIETISGAHHKRQQSLGVQYTTC